MKHLAGWSSPEARQAHNLKVACSNQAPATDSCVSAKPPGLTAHESLFSTTGEFNPHGAGSLACVQVGSGKLSTLVVSNGSTISVDGLFGLKPRQGLSVATSPTDASPAPGLCRRAFARPEAQGSARAFNPPTTAPRKRPGATGLFFLGGVGGIARRGKARPSAGARAKVLGALLVPSPLSSAQSSEVRPSLRWVEPCALFSSGVAPARERVGATRCCKSGQATRRYVRPEQARREALKPHSYCRDGAEPKGEIPPGRANGLAPGPS